MNTRSVGGVLVQEGAERRLQGAKASNLVVEGGRSSRSSARLTVVTQCGSFAGSPEKHDGGAPMKPVQNRAASIRARQHEHLSIGSETNEELICGR